MRRRRVPWRRSLVAKLMATSILVAVCAIAATAWLAVESTTRAIRQEQGRSLADDKSVYDTLLGYAAIHPDWSGAQQVVAERAAKLDRRITLMTEDRQVIADSHPGPSLALARPSATVDPLRVDLGLTGGTERIDPRAVGPYRLTGEEQGILQADAKWRADCLRELGIDATVRTEPDGRATVHIEVPDEVPAPSECRERVPERELLGDRKPLLALADAVARCLGQSGRRDIEMLTDYTVVEVAGRKVPNRTISQELVRGCVEKSRQAQLRPYVAPPALLFVTEPGDAAPEPVFNLSRANTIRIVAVTGAVLVVAVLITVLVGRRLVRPLRALTEAARRPVDDQARVPVTTNDEIGYLATALNDLSERREHAERLRRAMVGDVAHELRTPLTNIRSWLEAAQDGLAPADPQLLALLLEEAVLLQHIIDDLRDLAAADAGNLRIHPEPVAVGDVLAQVADAHRSAAEAAGVRLRTEAPGDPEAVVDPVRLRQLVGNLVSNAVRHTPAGGSVTVSAGHDGPALVIAVRDTGVGIAADELPRVFDRFWRADTSRTRATGGSGLGLPIARQLAEAHDGEITVASPPGAGTTFTVRLPSRLPAFSTSPTDPA